MTRTPDGERMSLASAARRVAVVVALTATHALAYRPFDGTDAAVAEPHEFELELGPAQWSRQGVQQSWVAPAVAANWGIEGDREIVLEGKVRTLRDPSREEHRTSLVDNALSLKQVHRRGSLQDRTGVSIASECGLLLPEVNGEHGTGFTCAAVFSQQLQPVTCHFNAALAYARDRHVDRFFSLILEGHTAGRLRPVLELFHERENGGSGLNSLLGGVILKIADDLSLDAATRFARTGGEDIREIRAGVTWTFSMR